jgi:hypothetical protein
MTAYEKFVFGLVLLWLLSHVLVKWGREAAIPAGVISLAESLITT